MAERFIPEGFENMDDKLARQERIYELEATISGLEAEWRSLNDRLAVVLTLESDSALDKTETLTTELERNVLATRAAERELGQLLRNAEEGQ